MKRFFLSLTVLFGLTQLVQNSWSQVNTESQVNAQLEYAPFSKHHSQHFAPVEGYNETNHLAKFKLGYLFQLNQQFKLNLLIGGTYFTNSYHRQSYGLGLGWEVIHGFRLKEYNFAFYVGSDFGLITGYKDFFYPELLFQDRYAYFLALNLGLSYALPLPSNQLRFGFKHVPAALFNSDSVSALYFAWVYLF